MSVRALYRRYSSVVGRWAARMCRPELEVDDIVQEVFLTVQLRLHTYAGASTVETWLYGITQNIVRHRRRRRRSSDVIVAMLAREMAPGPPGLALDDSFDERERAERLQRVLGRLPEKYRTVFVLYAIEERSGPEIASLMGLSTSAVKMRIKRARGRLAAALIGRQALQDRIPQRLDSRAA